VTFVVTEFPKLKSIDYEGYRRVRKKDFEAKVKAKEGEILTDKKIFDWQQEILKLYKEKGFLLVKVDHQTAKPTHSTRWPSPTTLTRATRPHPEHRHHR